MKKKLIHSVAGGVLAAVLAATAADAQAPPAAQQGPAAPQRQVAPPLTPGRLDQMLAPIALYPDDLLVQILMAATYPLDVVEAARWVQDPRNASLKGDQLFAALQRQNWDASVKSLAPFPSILDMMDVNLEWTERLGEAFLADPRALMEAIQRLRRRAQLAGRLVSTPQAIVQTVQEDITIETPEFRDRLRSGLRPFGRLRRVARSSLSAVLVWRLLQRRECRGVRLRVGQLADRSAALGLGCLNFSRPSHSHFSRPVRPARQESSADRRRGVAARPLPARQRPLSGRGTCRPIWRRGAESRNPPRFRRASGALAVADRWAGRQAATRNAAGSPARGN